jgi:hypothetical protein
MSFLLCWFLDADNDERLGRLRQAGVQKAPRHEVAGSWALAGSECYGDLMLAAVSIMGGTPVRRDVHVRVQVSPGECNGRLGGHTEFVNGWLAD